MKTELDKVMSEAMELSTPLRAVRLVDAGEAFAKAYARLTL